jgi:hypothetical protein
MGSRHARKFCRIVHGCKLEADAPKADDVAYDVCGSGCSMAPGTTSRFATSAKRSKMPRSSARLSDVRSVVHIARASTGENRGRDCRRKLRANRTVKRHAEPSTTNLREVSYGLRCQLSLRSALHSIWYISGGQCYSRCDQQGRGQFRPTRPRITVTRQRQDDRYEEYQLPFSRHLPATSALENFRRCQRLIDIGIAALRFEYCEFRLFRIGCAPCLIDWSAP